MELEVPDPVDCAAAEPDGAAVVEGSRGEIFLTGTVLRVDDVIELCLGDDVLLLEFAGRAPESGQVVRVCAAEIQLYPYDL
ncbi:hypothetical protein VSH64_30635 [Amycolatopsis rhabdoformis]|uniref:Uncharacterized protein n=1 Tax=Amycolatopsis rhabdoformis TaxID=1448059 RepID=A0ABZ1HYK4_9PSEU|nr:hypothetical protein [Amycolatopsis rhabdoformis]WSE27211.1 hypothetical protein VSH64_30635 [Amycolatopsis rhabdoformis]